MYVGMRRVDLKILLSVAEEFGLIILVRQANKKSLQYFGRRGRRAYYPKPAIIKAKTAARHPPPIAWKVDGRVQQLTCETAGLVVHPGFHAAVFDKEPAEVIECWNDTMEVLAPDMMRVQVNREEPESRLKWSAERRALHSPDWFWRVDTEWRSPHFGCLQLKSARTESRWCYLHGDYDLKDVIVAGKEEDNRKRVKMVDGVLNITPKLRRTARTHGMTFEELRNLLNQKMAAPLIQHGAEAQFAWHGPGDITVVYPGNKFEILHGADEVETWYRLRDRKVLARKPADKIDG
jgi:hypothetical protein